MKMLLYTSTFALLLGVAFGQGVNPFLGSRQSTLGRVRSAGSNFNQNANNNNNNNAISSGNCRFTKTSNRDIFGCSAGSSSASTAASCQQLCLDSNACQSADWGFRARECCMHRESASGNAQLRNAPGVDYFEKHCDAPVAPPSNPGSNPPPSNPGSNPPPSNPGSNPNPSIPSQDCSGTVFECDGKAVELTSADLASLPTFGTDDSGFEQSLANEVQAEDKSQSDLKTAAAGRANGDFGLASSGSINRGGGNFCYTDSKMVTPTKGRNYKNQLRYVVQVPGRFKQFFKLRICESPNAQCGGIYGATCQQEFNYQRVLVKSTYNRYGRHYSSGCFWDWFKIPTCCSCSLPTNYSPYRQ